ncbi:hypothetical protein D915_008882 [Fasciola hepatica]|uniref:Uncharacterized protein n=1 Tax=Fasciola hepatica TaxID=6192 RepID=A0A4E0QYH0_FASHE|nr:hypothetical protein D915_008882 [Fasciola hepatica]
MKCLLFILFQKTEEVAHEEVREWIGEAFAKTLKSVNAYTPQSNSSNWSPEMRAYVDWFRANFRCEMDRYLVTVESTYFLSNNEVQLDTVSLKLNQKDGNKSRPSSTSSPLPSLLSTTATSNHSMEPIPLNPTEAGLRGIGMCDTGKRYFVRASPDIRIIWCRLQLVGWGSSQLE